MRPKARLRVLTDAFDGAQLFELLQPVINSPAAQVTGIEPRLTRAEAVAEVRRALIAGEIFLSDVASVDQPLPVHESLQAVEQDSAWEPLPPKRILVLNLTSEGERALAELRTP